ncbi:uncharacterized protein LOC121860095 isoform X2 [Homarus americanus]|uniref:uncharacterized protein LOC121860095 isoform X2 n=1 Tax=Homarus americanus TaxID=6706 RepID=UPI001C49273D|nr:uncharacterized protein LOC121860095 isoform X2 [Homarus americanus]
MLKMLACSVVVLAGAVHGIELIENYYKGEKYEPEGRALEERYPYSSSLISATFAPGALTNPHPQLTSEVLQARKMAEEEGGDVPFASLMQQLGMALHGTLPNNQLGQTSKAGEPRNIDTKPEGKKDDLHYHFYPHNQHLFNLPECATQQVCNAVYKRLKFTQPLCQCPQGSDPCSVSYLPNDERSIELSMGGRETRATTLIKTCEPVWSVRQCRKPRDWSILALQNTRTGKAHYLVICKCPDTSKLEGPLNHDQPTYAQVPGIRVYGMMCVSRNYRRAGRGLPGESEASFPWERVTAALEGGQLLKDLMDEEDVGTPALIPLH